MSSRLRRPPSGRNNLSNNNNSSQPLHQAQSRQDRRPSSAVPLASLSSSSPRNFTPRQSRPVSASEKLLSSPISSGRKKEKGAVSVSSSSPRIYEARSQSGRSLNSRKSDECVIQLFSDRSDVNTREVLQQLRNKHADEERRKAAEETLLMSDYNPYSRPRPSSALPLRSAFLDPETNNFFPSKTRSELMKRIKLASLPHPSYDIDGDGWVSQEDYKLAKRFDFDGNGVIDPHERQIAKSVITDEFFKAHKENLHVFGDKIAKATHNENVTAVVNSKNFERTFGLLRGIEDSLKGRASKEMLGCMDTVYKSLTKHNFYTNKFDTAAWNDYDAIPRGDEKQHEMKHNGSRRRLMESRKAKSRLEGDNFHQQSTAKDKTIRNHRISLISNYALEN